MSAQDRSGWLMEYGVGLLSYIALRQGCHLENVMRGADKNIRRGSETAVLPHVIEVLIPQFNLTMKQLAELGVQQAFIERQRELTRAKRLENERTEAICGAGRRSHDGAAQTQTSAPAQSNGKARRTYTEADIEKKFTQPGIDRPFDKNPWSVPAPESMNGHAVHENVQLGQS